MAILKVASKVSVLKYLIQIDSTTFEDQYLLPVLSKRCVGGSVKNRIKTKLSCAAVIDGSRLERLQGISLYDGAFIMEIPTG